MPKQDNLSSPEDNLEETPEQKQMSEELKKMAESQEWQIPKDFQEIEGGDYEKEEKFKLLRDRHSYLQDRLGKLKVGEMYGSTDPNEVKQIRKEMKDLEEGMK